MSTSAALDVREERQSAVREQLSAHDVDAVLITHLPNVRYLTGFSGSSALLLLTSSATVFVTDRRYEAQASHEVGHVADIVIESTNVWKRLGQILPKHGARSLGFEEDVVTVAQWERLRNFGLSWTWRPLRGTVERLRERKSESEVEALQQAAALAHEALAEALGAVRPGVTEQELAGILERALRRRGSEGHPFATIVASGPNSALPHARATSRPIAPGDFVLIDFGAQLGGYCSDITRTVVVGRADERQRAVYDVVSRAQERARTNIRAGMAGREADALAREVIERDGLGAAFGHSLGHGLGLEVHEAPRLSASEIGLVPECAVVTIEPGVYLPGWGGVRIEDDVYVGPAGPVTLSDGRTELVEL